MAAGDTDIGTGTTLAFESMAAELLSISWSGISRGNVDTSHMGTTGGQTFLPTDLYDPGEISADFHFKTNETPPITATPSTLTITFPDLETWAVSAFMTGFEFTDPLEDKMTATGTFKASGSVTF